MSTCRLRPQRRPAQHRHRRPPGEPMSIIGRRVQASRPSCAASPACRPARHGARRPDMVARRPGRVHHAARVGFSLPAVQSLPPPDRDRELVLAPVHRARPGRKPVRTARTYLRRVRLPGKEGAYPGQSCPGGQRQRVAIARALAMRGTDPVRRGDPRPSIQETVGDVLVIHLIWSRDNAGLHWVTTRMPSPEEVSDAIYSARRVNRRAGSAHGLSSPEQRADPCLPSAPAGRQATDRSARVVAQEARPVVLSSAADPSGFSFLQEPDQ